MPDKPTNRDIAKALEDTTGKWVWCRSKDDGLIQFERGKVAPAPAPVPVPVPAPAGPPTS